MNNKLKRALTFIVVTFFFNYLLAGLFYALGGNYNSRWGLLLSR